TICGQTERLAQGLTNQIQTLGTTKFKMGDGSTHCFKAKAETMHLTPFGVKLAELMHFKYNTEHILHVLPVGTALMDFYKCLGNLKGG
ncbi:MAG: hypothetical protein ACKPKO_25500, partial [Candidatus Fonsibacter sp.]